MINRMAEIVLIQMLVAKRDRNGRMKIKGWIMSNVVRLSVYSACKKITWDTKTVYIHILSLILNGTTESQIKYNYAYLKDDEDAKEKFTTLYKVSFTPD